MRIIWVINGPVGKLGDLLGINSLSGGWIESTLEVLSGVDNIEVFVVTMWPVEEKKGIVERNITYTILPGPFPSKTNPNRKKIQKSWKAFIDEIRPDLIHIHGTEYLHGLALMLACPDEKFVISIQGLKGVIGRYYYAGMSCHEILSNITLYDVFSGNSLIRNRKKFLKHGLNEREYLTRAKNVIGRTTWDYVHSGNLCKNVRYFSCNRDLRSVFYRTNWSLEKAKKHSLFLSQSNYPIKGLHIVLKAICLLKDEYRDIKVIVAGTDLLSSRQPCGKWMLSGYAKYIRRIIVTNSLQNHVHFTGVLNDVKMAEYYRDSHIFICPSSIENNSNSLGEAQLIGIPCISSFVGGLPEITKNGEAGLLYRFEEYEMLAHYIRFIFENDDYAITLSNREKRIARQRHDRKVNMNNLLKIYEDILAR